MAKSSTPPSPRASRTGSARSVALPEAPQVSSSEPAELRVKQSKPSILTRMFGIDVRTLALFRIGLALVLLNDLRVRAADMGAFYSDDGVLPRSAVLDIYAYQMPNLVSFHLFSGLVGYEALLFILAAVCALCLLVGYRTRPFMFASWVLLISLQNRNPMILHGGDVVLRMLAFWGCFLPLGARWSFDQMLVEQDSPDKLTPAPATQRLLSMGTIAILLQMCFVYWFTVALKTEPEWRERGTALFYALSIDQLAKPLAQALLPHRALLAGLTTFTMLLERFGPILVLLPWWRLRFVMVVVLTGFHFCMALFLTLGLFPYAMALGWCLFLPSEFWDILARRYAAMPRNGLKVRIESLQARVELLKEAAVASRGGAGVKRVPLLQLLAPRLNGALTQIGRVGLQAVAGVFLLYILVWNYRSVDFNSRQQLLPTSYDWLGEGTRTDQVWDMFAPKPLVEDGWFVIPARLFNGQTVNLLRDGAPVDWTKPANLANSFANERWQKYALNLWPRVNSRQRALYGEYLARQWNNSHGIDEHVASMEMYFMRETTDLYSPTVTPKKVLLWSKTF